MNAPRQGATRRARGVLHGLLSAALALAAQGAAARGPDLVEEVCVRDLVRARPLGPLPVPVGCELVDCCPGCPSATPIELRIDLDTRVVSQAELHFEALASQEFERLKITGAAERKAGRIVVRAGSTRIGGFPARPDGPAPVVMLRPLTNDRAVRRFVARRSPAGAAHHTERIVVRQFAGPYLVNSLALDVVIRPCGAPPARPAAAGDRLKIEGVAPGDEVIVMLDARTSAGCMDGGSSPEWVFPTTGDAALENLLSAGACRSEIAVFSKKHAMKWQSLTWTDAPGDVRTVVLEPPVQAALHIWVPDDQTRILAEEHAQRAHDLFLENRVGVRFVWNVRKLSDVPNAPANALDIVRAGVSDDALDCLDLASIRAQPFYVPNALNVYYVNKAFSGRNCAIKSVPATCVTSSTPPDHTRADANIIFVGSIPSPTTLAHEIGHAYGLRPAQCDGHTNEVAGFGPDNVMWAGGSMVPRTRFSLGQVFRMNTHGDDWGGTMLIANDVPGRTPRPCFPHQWSAACPRLDLRWP